MFWHRAYTSKMQASLSERAIVKWAWLPYSIALKKSKTRFLRYTGYLNSIKNFGIWKIRLESIDIYIYKVGTISLSPQGGAFTRALKSENSLSPPTPVGGGAVDTNDWCIICAHTIAWQQPFLNETAEGFQDFQDSRFIYFVNKGDRPKIHNIVFQQNYK